MAHASRSAWLPRLLFHLALLLSAGLILLVLLSPLFDNGAAPPDGWPRLVALFARDATLRRTALASALGLTVTACIFFREPTPRSSAIRKRRPRRSPPDATGA